MKNLEKYQVTPSGESITKAKSATGIPEWASSQVSIYKGCGNLCKYCWACANAVRCKQKNTDDWKVEVVRQKEVDKNRMKLDGRIMFPGTHDITPNNIDNCLIVLKKLLEAGNELLIVSKPRFELVKRLCNELSPHKKNILFRFSIGSKKQSVLDYWEPEAPKYKERLKCLKYAFDKGFATSVSAEPTLHPDIMPMIEELLPFVTDAIWVGRPNMFMQRLSINGYKDEETVRKARKLLASLDESWAKSLYRVYKKNPKIKWKDGLKKVLGLELSKEKGLDV